MKVSCIIPTMPGREALVKKLLSTIPKEYETIIVGDEDLLLAAKRNKGARQATGDYLLFIDDDNYLRKNAIENMVSSFREDIGVMGMVACYHGMSRYIADGGSKRNYLTGFTQGLNTNERINDIPLDLYEVDEAANAFMIPSTLFHRVGGFDEDNFPIDLDEADLCKRIKNLGYKIVYNPKAVCYHDSITYSHIPDFRRPLNAYFLSRNIINFQRKHLDVIPYWMFIIFFLPIRIGFYTASLIWRKKLRIIPYMLKGYWRGIIGNYENEFERKAI